MHTEAESFSGLSSSRPRSFVLSSGLEDLHTRYSFTESKTPEAALFLLARALTSSPLWKETPRAVMVVKPLPRPALAVIGFFDAAGEARMSGLHAHLEEVLYRLRYVDYPTAEDDCEKLAQVLTDRFGREDLARFCFAPMPRGGFIVLGMLSYLLNLRHEQVQPPYPPDIPLVVVDDCALTGLRFSQYLSRSESGNVVFAPLYAHPQLRAAIESAEPRVTACVSARDLHDHAPDRLETAYSDWHTRWEARSGSECYWIGQPDHVCFPWNEPDVTFWNSAVNREERGWRVVPPQYCLKNRPTTGVDLDNRLQVQPAGKGDLKPATHVLFGELEGELIVADMKEGISFSLDGVAADAWRAVVAGDTLVNAVRALTGVYDVDEATLHADLGPFIEDLLSKGLLVKNDVRTPDG